MDNRLIRYKMKKNHFLKISPHLVNGEITMRRFSAKLSNLFPNFQDALCVLYHEKYELETI